MRHSIEFTAQKLRARLPHIIPLIHRRKVVLEPFRYCTLPGPEAEPLVGPQVDDSGWEVIPHNSYWGSWGTSFMMRGRFQVPTDWDPSRPAALYLPLGVAGDIFCHPEALAYLDGDIVGSADRQHHEIYLPERFCGGQEHELALHGWTGHASWPIDPHSKIQLFMRECALVEIDIPTRDFCALAHQAIDVAQKQNTRAAAQMQILDALNEAFEILDTRAPISRDGPFYDTVPEALAALRQGMEGGTTPLAADLIAIGHAHIDVAYLWQVSQTRRKCGRTFANVLQLMDQHPDYRFSQSQAFLYATTQEDYPELFDQIIERVHQGRWEVMGGMWVEPDCNLAGGEGLVRQLMFGRGYYRDTFGEGVETPVAWLPDTFGFTASLPQLLRQAGLKWFLGNKLNWNQYNKLPNNLFFWEGIDGSRILSFFLTTPSKVQYLPHPTTYKAELTAEEVFGTWDEFGQKAAHNELPICYGYGDGGGGPTRELIMAARNYGRLPGVPKMKMGSAREFFEGVQDRATGELPIWVGELYLELHRGTFTSQARIKQLNRQCEHLLHDTEFLASYAAQLTGTPYPAEALEAAWKLVCLNQFHDILPGTAIGEVFEDAARDYGEVKLVAGAAKEAALGALRRIAPKGSRALAVNTIGFTRDRHVILPVDEPLGDPATGAALVSQTTEDGVLATLPAMPGYGVVTLAHATAPAPESALRAAPEGDAFVMENDLIRVEIGPNGQLTRIFDRIARREVLAPGETGNQLLAFEDRPMQWDAWDIDIFYEDRCDVIDTPVSIELIETGPVRATVKVVHDYRGSRIEQKVSLYHNSKRIDFRTVIDWTAQKTLLKVAFPVDIHAKDATYDIQFGNMRRPTHRNTSWDWARFEVVGHKWADLSEGNYGVALLNDCKYGYDIQKNVLRLSLLKGATMPDPFQDQHRHEFTYALLPHEGDWRDEVIAEGYDLNLPVPVLAVNGEADGDAPIAPFVACDTPTAVIETVKRAEDGAGHIVRLYEAAQNRGPVRLSFGFPVASVSMSNILEEPGPPLEVTGDAVELWLTPYQIATLRVVAA